MARTLAPDRERATIAAVAAIAVLGSQTAPMQLGVIAVGALIGWRFLAAPEPSPGDRDRAFGFTARWAAVAWVLFVALLLGLPVLAGLFESQVLRLLDAFYRVGSLVFGGGHVVLPLIQAEVVPPGWLTNDEFTAGYGAAQAVPGPLFSFAAYLGAVAEPEPNGLLGAAITLVAIYVPSFLLLLGVLPVWDSLRGRIGVRRALVGINAAVVGILLAALYNPVWTSAIFAPEDFALAVAAFGLLALWRWPPWLVVVLAALGGQALEVL